MVTDSSCDEHNTWAVGSLCCTPEMDVMLCINTTKNKSIFKNTESF